ncbi:MAG: PilZ domain-containing protein [Syntrophobacterales bacterium]|nr:MAG: PilZ domain-containing protein [Syntrophobacterales bacterium]
MKRWRGMERRKFLRLKSPLPVWFNLYHVLGKRETSRKLGGMISNVSHEGICLETNVVLIDGSHLFSEAMTEEKRLKLEIDLPAESEKIVAMGKVVWYDLSSSGSPYRFRAGVYLTKMDENATEIWGRFLTALRK